MVMSLTGPGQTLAEPQPAYRAGGLRPGLGLGIGSSSEGAVFMASGELAVFYWDYLAAGLRLAYQNRAPQLVQAELRHLAYLPLGDELLLHGLVGVGRWFLWDYADLWYLALGAGPTLHVNERVGVELTVIYRLLLQGSSVAHSGVTLGGGVFFSF